MFERLIRYHPFMANGGPVLRREHPCATAFLDETGAIASDQIFAVGLLKLTEASRMLRAIQKWRDRHHWYKEIKFSHVTAGTLSLYKEVAELCLTASEPDFFCFVADRSKDDPIARFGTHWDAYGKLAEQLVVAVIRPPELVALMADNYSTPDHILFEENLRSNVNRRLRRLALVSVCRLDSGSSDGLQVVDLLTSATAYEFRQHAGLAGSGGPKDELAKFIRNGMGTESVLKGYRCAKYSIAIYRERDHTAPSRLLASVETPNVLTDLDP